MIKPHTALIMCTFVIGIMGRTSPAVTQALGQSTWPAQCSSLASADFTHIVDAPTQISSAAPGASTQRLPTYCQVQGYVEPQVRFRLGLPPPEKWNGKFFETGCGGACGDDTEFELSRRCGGPLEKGYACIAFHVDEGVWALNNNLQAQIDFGYRGVHVTALAGKAIVERYYGKPPAYAYFCGCSTGGRMALVEAQRFPWDFNGIISGAPWINDTDSAMNFVWAYRALRSHEGKPIVSRSDLQVLHDAVLAKCDMDDGVKDGIIGNPAACRFDPATLLCKSGKTDRCLSQAQIDAVKKVYAGPATSKGERLYVSGAALGSEMGWVDEVLDYIRSDGTAGGSESWALEYFRYMVMPPAGRDWQLSDFDFDRDYKRFNGGTQESLLNAANPDLRKFQAAGGKLLIFQGWNDQSDLPQMTIDYYETVSRAMGGRARTEAFARLFLIPGMLHCSGGDGAFAIDYLSALEHWVEGGRAPEKLVGAHVDDAYLARLGSPNAAADDRAATFSGALMLNVPLDPDVPVAFTRPVYPFPLRAKYKGAGDSKDAASFRPVEP